MQKSHFCLLIAMVPLLARSWHLGSVLAGDGHCAHCGGHDAVSCCRLVTEQKKVSIICWGVQDEDFCLPCRSQRGCQHCESVCEECLGSGSVQTGVKKFVWSDWLPLRTQPGIRKRRKLMKRTVTKQLPSYKWVVQDLCPDCRIAAMPKSAPPIAKLPPIPPGNHILLSSADVPQSSSQESTPVDENPRLPEPPAP